MAITDLLPGGTGQSAEASMAEQAAAIAAENPGIENPPDPYDGTARERGVADREEAATPPAPEPAKPAEQPPAAQPPPAAADSDDDPKSRVPLAELKKERGRRQEIERELYQLQGQVRAWQQAMQQQMPGQPQPEAPPDPTVDPLGALAHLAKRVEGLQEGTKEQQQALQAQQMRMQAHAAAARGAAAFTQEQPDYPDALRYLVTQRREELAALGFAEQADMMIEQELERNIMFPALQRGQNPAALAYAVAKARGYQMKAPEPVTPVVAPAPVIPPAPPAPKAAAAVALPSGGRAEGGAISIADAANGSVADQEKWFEQMRANSRGRKSLFDSQTVGRRRRG